MKFYIVLLSIVVACQAVSFFELVVEEWETYKVSGFYRHFFFFNKKKKEVAMVCHS